MLVLGRKAGESIILGNMATITVLGADPHTVRLHVDTPALEFTVTLRLSDPPLVIGRDWVTVAFLSLRGETARLGILAAKETAIDRSEVRERKLAALGQEQGQEWWEERHNGC